MLFTTPGATLLWPGEEKSEIFISNIFSLAVEWKKNKIIKNNAKALIFINKKASVKL